MFTFEILEMFDKKKEQSQDGFIDDLKILKELWGEKIDLHDNMKQ